MKAALIFLAVVVAMASAAGVNFVDNSPPQNGNGVHVVDNSNGVNFVDNSPPQNGNGVHVVDNSNGVNVVDNNPDNGQQVNFVDNAQGGYEPIDIGPAFVEPQQGYVDHSYLRSGK
ncbi:hypothetical protein evm_007627 [Chilo suppressalis]|nr:hypothetical protein evm_007627 [Chilo suppressalis]